LLYIGFEESIHCEIIFGHWVTLALSNVFLLCDELDSDGYVKCVSFEMVEMARRGLNWLVKNLGYL